MTATPCPRCGETHCNYAGRWGSAFQRSSVSEWCLACGYAANLTPPKSDPMVVLYEAPCAALLHELARTLYPDRF